MNCREFEKIGQMHADFNSIFKHYWTLYATIKLIFALQVILLISEKRQNMYIVTMSTFKLGGNPEPTVYGSFALGGGTS